MQRRRIKQLEVAATELAEQVEETVALIDASQTEKEIKDCCALCSYSRLLGNVFGNDVSIFCCRYPTTITKLKKDICGEFKGA